MVIGMTMKSSLLGAVVASALALPASATPVQFGGNFYEYVSALDISWSAARASAAGMSFMAVGGHLATVTSAAENAFLDSISPDFGSFAGAWLGGDATKWLVGPEAGQSYTYTNWGGIEPNNSPSNVYMNIGPLFAGISHARWADAGGGVSDSGDPIKGYFVEYETNLVTEPASLALIGAALAGLGVVRRRSSARS